MRLVVLLSLIAVAHLSAQQCGSQPARAGDSAVDLAPLAGFVEVCSRDAQLCNVLTAGYPPSVKTLGYFVPSGEWDAFRKDSSTGFKHYLIAQLALTLTPDQLPGFKDYLRAQQGDIPDHSDLPRVLVSQGRVALGILDETPTSISSGVIMKARPVGSETTITLAATNTAAVIRNHVFSLYVFADYQSPADVDTVKVGTRTWVQCLMRANR